LRKENINQSREPGFLHDDLLASTVADAILLMQKLGEKYIRIDQLCIVQDDLEDKHKVIPAMSVIYRNAAYTLVAACDDSATWSAAWK
jgi:Heterokaryon incompatibility protein (HET)